MTDQILTQRVLIDPQRLIKLKKQRKTLKFVPSIYEPPQDSKFKDNESKDNHLLSMQSQQNSISEQFRYQFIKKSKNANVDFILSLIGSIKKDQIIELQEGDCLDIRFQERSLILQGQIKITGNNSNSYFMQEGYFFFISSQSYKKIKQIICLKQTKILRISNAVYERQLKNYLFLKNAQKIKYLKYCPFFIWNDHLSEDLASCMKMEIFQKQEVIYSSNTKSQKIYFVKEGIILLQRDANITNKFFIQYQNHYEKNQINEQEVTLIVKKGMVFGIDGILLKEIDPASPPTPALEIIDEVSQHNPQIIKYNNSKIKLNTRIYTARTIGRTQVYSIHRQAIETLFNLTDMAYNQQFPKILTKADLLKICSDYSQMVINHKSLPKISQTISRKNLIVDKAFPSTQIQQKKAKAKCIRFQQQLTKKLSIANIIADPKSVKMANHRAQFTGSHDQNASLLNQLNYRLSSMEVPNENNNMFAFPLLTSSLKKRNRSPKTDNNEKYIFKWLKDSVDPSIPRRRSNQSLQVMQFKRRQKAPKIERQVQSKQKKLNLIKIKSYRSIIQTLL